jgi:hypothetical protein
MVMMLRSSCTVCSLLLLDEACVVGGQGRGAFFLFGAFCA